MDFGIALVSVASAEFLRSLQRAICGLIKPTFDRLAEQRSDEDVSHPSIEFYRRNDTIDLLLPIASAHVS